MQSVTPVITGLEPYEVKIGGPEAGQPEYQTLHALRTPDGKVMSRWHFTDEERKAIAAGDDICVTIWTGGGPYPPTQVHVQNPEVGAEFFLHSMYLDDALALRILNDDMTTSYRAFEEKKTAFDAKCKEVHEKIHST